MRICVTGGTGHVGSRLVESIKENHTVTVVDSMATQRYPVLFSWANGSPVRFIEGDILTLPLESIFKEQDVVIHLAAITDAESSKQRSADTWGVNYGGAVRVADTCARLGVKLAFPSTTSIYGKSEGVVDEDCEELRPQSPYAEAKRQAEKYIMETPYLQWSILRCATVYGIGVGHRFHTAVNKLSLLAATGKPLTVWETAINQKRPYLYIEDMVSAFLHVIENGLWCRMFNVVTENSTMGEIVSIIKRHRPDLTVEYVSSPIMNQLSYTVSADRLKATGWTPNGNLADGIAQTMAMLGGIHG